jgi:molybdopterin converting factor small subunit
MPVTVFLSTPLRPFASGRDRVVMPGAPATLGEALEALWKAHPALRDRVLTEQGDVRPHVNVFVGSESIRHTGSLATPLAAACDISIFPAVSGGAPRFLPG